MAEEVQKPVLGGLLMEEKLTVVSEAPVVEKPSSEKPSVVEAEEVEKPKILESVSYKEESNVVDELPESEKKALGELILLIQEALNKHEFTAPSAPPSPPPVKEEEKLAEEEKKEEETAATVAVVPPPPVEEEKVVPPAEVVVAEVVEKVTYVDEDGAKTLEAIEETIVAVSVPEEPVPVEATAEEVASVECKEEAEVPATPPPPPEEVFIWGIPLLGDERSDVILLKFLRARDFKVKEAFTMIKNTVRWRKEFGIEAVVDEDLGNEWDKVVFMDGFDKEGHPVCYNVYGEFQNKELYQNTFGDEEKRLKFLKWRIQFLEKSIRKLDFSPTGISTIVQINDLKNSPLLAKKELRQTTNQALQLLQDNYPEFVAKQVFVNVPWWYLAFSRMISPFLTQRTKTKFVFAGPSKTAETLFKYIAPEQVPVQYGGLNKEEFTTADPVTEVAIKPSAKQTVEFPVSETCLFVWELRVVGWDVNYGAEFVPSAEDAYTVIIQKKKKITPADEPVISNSYKIGEPGKIVVTIENQTSKKKQLLHRSKTKPLCD